MKSLYTAAYYLWGFNAVAFGVAWYLTGHPDLGLISMGAAVIAASFYWAESVL